MTRLVCPNVYFLRYPDGSVLLSFSTPLDAAKKKKFEIFLTEDQAERLRKDLELGYIDSK